MTITISGASVTEAKAKSLIHRDRLTRVQRLGTSHFHFEEFWVNYAWNAVNAENLAFVSTNDFTLEAKSRILEAHVRLTAAGTLWRGRTNGNYIAFSAIPAVQRAAVVNLIENHLPAPGHHRSAHRTNPSFAPGGTYQEYDLTASEDGRLTTRIANQIRAFYYSRHHAAGTYEYLLIRDDAGRPYFRGVLPAGLVAIPTPAP